MPNIYLSSSAGNGPGTEGVARLADAMAPYLQSCGIRFRREAPALSSAGSSGTARYDLRLALCRGPAGEEERGGERGLLIFYDPGVREGERAAGLLAKNLRMVYPLSDRVRTEASSAPEKEGDPESPTVSVQIGRRDNYSDTLWTETHRDAAAQGMVRALTQFFGLPFLYPIPPAEGIVRLVGGTLHLRCYPSRTAAILTELPGGAHVVVCGEWQGWYVVQYGPFVGYAAAIYIQI